MMSNLSFVTVQGSLRALLKIIMLCIFKTPNLMGKILKYLSEILEAIQRI